MPSVSAPADPVDDDLMAVSAAASQPARPLPPTEIEEERNERTFFRGRILRKIRHFVGDNGPLAVMFSVVFVNLVGFGIVVPLMPFFAQSLSAAPFAVTAPWMVTLMFATYSLGQFFAEPFCGRLSDRIGRKPILLVTTALSMAFYVCLALTHNIWLAILIRFFSGLASGNISTIQGYVSDVSKPEQRTARLGLIGAAFSLGFVIGPFIGGVLTNEASSARPFELPLFVAAGMSAVAALGVLFFVKESRQRTATAQAQPDLIKTAIEGFRTPAIRNVIIASLGYMAAFAGLEATFAMWTRVRYNWHAHNVGTIFLFIGVTAAIMQTVIMRPLVRRWGEARVLAAGLFFFGLSFVLQSINHMSWLITPIVMLGTMGQAVIFVSICAIISHATPPDRQGAMLGLNMSTGAVARVTGPVVAGFLFSAVGPEAPLWMGALLTMPAALLALKVGRLQKR
ncbi:MFS transporter [Asticcacaulis solisilvae]|uniref:MFS transporter n=1 Tax=Asticcacaulis solisilvae TaxID=1217274 RepID=UPI003FD6C19A